MPNLQLPLSSFLSSVSEDESMIFPLIEAQLAELELVCRQFGPPIVPFARGERVVYKHKVGSLKNEVRNKLVMVFWRMLDPAAPIDQLRLQKLNSDMLTLYPDPNCLVLLSIDDRMDFRVSQVEFLVRVRTP